MAETSQKEVAEPRRSSSVPPASSRRSLESLAEPSVLDARGLIAPPLSQEAPRHRRFLRTIYRLGHGLYVHDAFAAAPAMAFHFFLSLLPLLVFLGYVLALVAKHAGIDTVLAPLLARFPQDSEAIVKGEVERLAGATTLGPLAAVGFLWVAAGGTHGLMNALEVAVGAPRRPWWKKRLLALAWVIGSLVVITGLSFGVVQWDALVAPEAETTAADTRPDTRPAPPSAAAEPSSAVAAAAPAHVRRRLSMLRNGAERAVALGISLALATFGLAGFYRFSISRPTRVKRRAFPGAVLAIGLWLLISWGFGLYVRSLSDYAVFYGSLAAVVVLLVWLWLTSLAILVGAELNAQLEGLRD